MRATYWGGPRHPALTSSWTECEKCLKKKGQKPLIAATTPAITRHTLHSLHCAYLSLLLRHFHCSRDSPTCRHDLHNRDVDHFVEVKLGNLNDVLNSVDHVGLPRRHNKDVNDLKGTSTTLSKATGATQGESEQCHNRDVDDLEDELQLRKIRSCSINPPRNNPSATYRP